MIATGQLRTAVHPTRLRVLVVVLSLSPPRIQSCCQTKRQLDTKAKGCLSDDWIVKARIWCQYYAEQLRTWDLLGQAVELEKVAGLTITLTPTTQDPSDGIIPQANTGQSSKGCGICHTSVKGIETTCPSCLHISHLSCVQNFTAELDGDGFECPTGCGCLCSELPFLAQELHHESSTGSRPPFKKKPSYTDPRRWRARIEGDSW